MCKIIPNKQTKKDLTQLLFHCMRRNTPSSERGGQKEYSASLYVWYLKTTALARYDTSPITFFSHMGTLAEIT